MKKITISGKRKRAVARATIQEGTGKVLINRRDYKTLQLFDKLKIEEPIRLAQEVLSKLNFDVSINVIGGGEKSQIDASRLALAKAIIEFTKSEKLKEIYMNYDRNLLVADIRRKETYKPGDSKARSKRQSSKR